jgi:ABC-2 type transport system ATP-binding protein
MGLQVKDHTERESPREAARRDDRSGAADRPPIAQQGTHCMIQVEHLSKTYGTRQALYDVTFSVAKGEVLGFLGPNAAGKTTTMRILTGYLPASGGSATVAGYDVMKQSIDVRRHIGYLPETVPLYPEMSVRSYLDFMAKIKGLPGKNRKAEIDRVMEMVGVEERESQLIGKLSRGYRQRVGLAQAILGGPDVLILDEPTVGLDPRQIIEIRNLIKGLGGEHTVMLSTHILPEVSATCSRVIIISDGRVVAEDTPENLTKRLRGADSVQLEVRGPRQEVAAQLRKLPRVIDVQAGDSRDGHTAFVVACEIGTDVREQLAATIVGKGWGLLELRPVGMSLEEIFLQLTTSEDAA